MAWYTVGLLSVAYLVSLLDRVILSMLVAPIQADLHLSDTQMGLLLGTAFGVFYTLMSLPMGRLVDRVNRRNLVVVGIVGWSLMTIASGLARDYWQMFGARMGVGIGEAILAPAAWSMIADLFPADRRGRAIGVFYIGASVGIGLAMVVSSVFLAFASSELAQAVSHATGLGAWRLILIAAGLPGLFVALLLLTVQEPARGLPVGQAEDAGPTWRETSGYLWSNRAGILPVFVGVGCLALTAYSVLAWVPTALSRDFQLPVAQVGFAFGLVMCVLTPIATPLGGFLLDRQVARGNEPFYVHMLCAAGAGIALSLGSLAASVSYPIALGLLGAFTLSYFLVQAPAAGFALRVAPTRMRGTISAVFVLVINLVGIVVGPPLVAAVSTAMDPSGHSLRRALALVCAGSACLSMLLLLVWRGSVYQLFSATRESPR